MNSKSKKIAAACLALAMVASVGAANGVVFATDSGNSSAAQSEQTPQEKLEALLTEIDGLNADDYTEDSWNELKEQADSVVRPVKPYDEETEEGMPDWVANIMYNNILALKDNLVKKQTPQEKLEALLTEIDGLNADDYTEDSWNELKEQADSVVRPVKPYDEETEEGMPDFVANIMYNNILALKDALVKQQTPQEKLEALLTEIDGLNADDYTEDSWNELKEQADSVVRPVKPYDEETEEGMPDFVANLMYNNILALKDALVPASSQKTAYEKLEEKLKEAEALNSDDYTAESWAAVQEIIDSVDRPVSSDNITEKLATKLLNDLEKAMNALEAKPDEGISLADGTYFAKINSSSLESTAKIVAKNGKYSVTLYTQTGMSQRVEGDYTSNKVYTYYQPSDYYYPIIEVIKPENNEQFKDNMYAKFAKKNLDTSYDLDALDYNDERKNAISSDNDDLFFDTSCERLENNGMAFTFETDELDSEFYINGLYGAYRHDYDGTAHPWSWALGTTVKFDKDDIVKLEDNVDDIDVVCVASENSKDRNRNQRNIMRDPSVKIRSNNGKIYATYNFDSVARVNNVNGGQSAEYYGDDGEKLDVSDGTVTFEYDNYDQLIAGSNIYAKVSVINDYAGAMVRTYKDHYSPDFTAQPVVITDETTGIKLYSTTKYISDDAKLKVELVKDTGSTDKDKDPYANALTHLPKFNKIYYFKFTVTDNGNEVTDFGGDVSLEVPKVEGLKDGAVRLFLNKYDKDYKTFAFGWFNQYLTVRDDCYSVLLDYDYLDGNWAIYDEKLSDSDGSQLEDGTYKVPITTFNEAQPDQTSMSAQCLGETATLVVKDGVKRLELDFKPVDIGEMQGYLIQMWSQRSDPDWTEDKGWTEVTYTDYYKNADGSYYTDDLNKGTNNFYPKKGYLILPNDDVQFSTKFRVSAMDAIMGDNGDATRSAIFTIYYDEAEKISDETPDPDPEENPNFEPADMSKLEALVAQAEGYNEDDYTTSTFTTMKNALASAKTVLANSKATQEEVDGAVSELQSTIDALEKKQSEPELDINNLPDGKYQLYAQMIKTDRESFSMSNEGINHTVQLEVVNGEYYITVQFKGLAIYNQFGYLQKLSYYDKGYSYNDYGIPQGDVIPAEVLSTYDIVDQYNTADTPYPQLLKFKLVDKAGEKFVPLQVFVPIMEAISDGTGTQDVLMQIDWSTLKKTDKDIDIEDPEEQSPALDYTDDKTGVKIHADKGVFAEGTTAEVTEITSGNDFDSAKQLISSEADKFHLYDIAFKGSDGNEAKPNGKISVSIPVPSDYANPVVYRIADGKKTLISGTTADGMFTFSAKEAGQYLIEDKKTDTSDNKSDNKNSSSSSSADSKSNAVNGSSNANPTTGAATKAGLLAVLSGAVLVFTKKRKDR